MTSSTEMLLVGPVFRHVRTRSKHARIAVGHNSTRRPYINSLQRYPFRSWRFVMVGWLVSTPDLPTPARRSGPPKATQLPRLCGASTTDFTFKHALTRHSSFLLIAIVVVVICLFLCFCSRQLRLFSSIDSSQPHPPQPSVLSQNGFQRVRKYNSVIDRRTVGLLSLCVSPLRALGLAPSHASL